jgi:OOP family OmpA-OmpF porin
VHTSLLFLVYFFVSVFSHECEKQSQPARILHINKAGRLRLASEAEQKLADTGKEVVDTNKRIDALDQYELVKVVPVLFGAKSATLTDNAKAQLDEVASNAPGAKNYLIEVKGYTDVTGPASTNLDLSLERADAVVQYLAVKNIPLRRMTIPMGYGGTKSGAMTEAGRELENRVDVRILVNKGLSK